MNKTKSVSFNKYKKCPKCKETVLNGIECWACGYEKSINDEFKECVDCVHKDKVSPCPCDSCEQDIPTNFTEEDVIKAFDLRNVIGGD